MIIDLHDAAEAELTQAVEWYDNQEMGLGDEFIQDFQLAANRILMFPEAWPKISPRSRRCRLTKFPYGIVYQIRKNMILVVAVMHLHRKPGYWNDREYS